MTATLTPPSLITQEEVLLLPLSYSSKLKLKVAVLLQHLNTSICCPRVQQATGATHILLCAWMVKDYCYRRPNVLAAWSFLLFLQQDRKQISHQLNETSFFI